MKPTQALFRRLRKFQMSRKAGPRGYYRGTRTGKTGEHTNKGGYIINYDWVRSFVPPEAEMMKNFKVSLGKLLGERRANVEAAHALCH